MSSLGSGPGDDSRAAPSEVEPAFFPGWGQAEFASVVHPLGRRSSSSLALLAQQQGTLPKGSPEAAEAPDASTALLAPPGGGGDGSGGPVGDAPALKSRVDDAHKLGQWTATAISGNDILSSCLYTVGLTAVAAGVYAPFCMLLVVTMLYLFRSIYGEVCTALPLNGGAYNALLNSTSKGTASVAAVLTILSYVATGVVSATEACHYLQTVWHALDVYWATIGLLALFMCLSLVGMTESSVVALAIFGLHVSTLLLVVGFASAKWAHEGMDTLKRNWHSELNPPVLKALGYGFSAASLGITGFETSANFIEEQKDGVFVKTLRNMWVSTLVFNPALGLLTFAVVPIEDVLANSQTALGELGLRSSGKWLETLVSVDAFLVLAGSVLTAYVGVIGLVRRLAGDRCMPAFLMRENRLRGTPHFIIVGFFLVCSSLFAMVNGNVENLAGVYSISFLLVMSLFAVGDMLLKYKRDSLPREVRSSWPALLLGWALVVFALAMTIVRNPEYFVLFAAYFVATGAVFSATFYRNQVLKLLLYSLRRCSKGSARVRRLERWLTGYLRRANSLSVVFFANTQKLSVLNKAVLYVRDNERASRIKIVHVAARPEDVPPRFLANVATLDETYPKIRIDAVVLTGEFGPAALQTCQDLFHVQRNLMFITCPSKNFRHRLAHLGGVRVITHWTSEGARRSGGTAAAPAVPGAGQEK